MTLSPIESIEKMADAMSGGDPVKARSLIVGWSAFTGSSGKLMTVDKRSWGKVSEGWVKAIHFKARAAYKIHVKATKGSGELFGVEAVPKKKMAVRVKDQAESRLPSDGPENHWEGEPF